MLTAHRWNVLLSQAAPRFGRHPGHSDDRRSARCDELHLLSEIGDDPAEVADALEHSECEQGHAAAFAARAARLEWRSAINVDGKHWKRPRRLPALHCRAGLYRLPDRPGDHAGIVRRRKLFARREGGTGESRRDLLPASQPRKESTSITLCRFSGRSEPETRSVSMTRSAGCIWM